MIEAEIADRIKVLMAYAPALQRAVSGGEISEVLGVSAARVSQIRQTGKLTVSQVMSLCHYLGADYRWLLTGKGNVNFPERNDPAPGVTEVAHQLSLLPASIQGILRALIEDLALKYGDASRVRKTWARTTDLCSTLDAMFDRYK